MSNSFEVLRSPRRLFEVSVKVAWVLSICVSFATPTSANNSASFSANCSDAVCHGSLLLVPNGIDAFVLGELRYRLLKDCGFESEVVGLDVANLVSAFQRPEPLYILGARDALPGDAPDIFRDSIAELKGAQTLRITASGFPGWRISERGKRDKIILVLDPDQGACWSAECLRAVTLGLAQDALGLSCKG